MFSLYQYFWTRQVIIQLCCLFQGIGAVIAESYERIHRSNLVGMGIVPLQYLDGQTADSIGLTGKESYNIIIPEDIKPGQIVTVQVC